MLPNADALARTDDARLGENASAGKSGTQPQTQHSSTEDTEKIQVQIWFSPFASVVLASTSSAR
jgi:hypothetical protein